MENVNLTFWVKAISLAATFGSQDPPRLVLITSKESKNLIFDPLTPPSGLIAANLCPGRQKRSLMTKNGDLD